MGKTIENMKMQFRILVSILVFSSLALSCGKDEDVPDIIRTDGLTFIIQNQFVSLPAKVSVFFKVERTADGTPVAGMQDKDFIIYETNKSNNTTKVISKDEADRQISPRAQKFGYSTLLILDLSGSVTNNNLPNLKSASKQFINSVLPDNNDGSVQIGISWFDGENKLHELQAFTSNKTNLLAAIDGITSNISKDNSTDLYGAVIKSVDYINNVFRAYQNDDRAYAASAIIFTDGTDQAARFTLDQSLNAVNSADKKITFYSIGLGSEIDESVLKKIGKNGFAFAENTSKLVETFDKIAKQVFDDANSYYLFEYCSPKRNGTHRVKIEGIYQNLKGNVSTDFDANGFTGGCVL
jgi:uncharacterized protein YegL